MASDKEHIGAMPHKTASELSMATDPVCHMKVNPATTAAFAEYKGHTYHFCSKSCHKKFQSEPDKFLDDEEGNSSSEKGQLGTDYTCPMHPEIRQNQPGSCPKCGMALEPVVAKVSKSVEYTCPMHPQIVQVKPGSCPLCGMALEPRTITIEDGPNHELIDMNRRFWIGAALSIPIFLIAMGSMLPGKLLHFLDMQTLNWIQLVFATPVVLWCGWPFFVRAWDSVIHRSPNMFTLIALGVGAAYLFSLAATLTPWIFPEGFRMAGGAVEPYFDTAAIVTVLVLLGQMLELRARHQTSGAIRKLLGLAPQDGSPNQTRWT